MCCVGMNEPQAIIEQLPQGVGDTQIRHRVTKQRAHLMGCLADLATEPTNNRVERVLLPPVIARKISCGNKTACCRQPWQILASLVTTGAQCGHGLINYLVGRMPLPASSAFSGYGSSVK